MTNALRLSGVTLPGTAYPKKKNFIIPNLPVKTGLVGLYVLGGSSALSLVNHANPALPLAAVGLPTINALGAVCNYQNCFDTGIPGTSLNDLTVISVAKPVVTSSAASQAMIASNYNGAGEADSSCFLYASSVPRFSSLAGQVGGTTLSSAIVISTYDNTKWNSFASRMTSAGKAKSWTQVSGAQTVGAESAAGSRSTVARNIRVGGHHSANASSFVGSVELQMVAIFAASLADAEIAQNLAYLNATYGPALGLSTL